jgi:hypothetical protein
MTNNIIDAGDGYIKVEKKFFDEVMNACVQNLMLSPEDVQKNKMLTEFIEKQKEKSILQMDESEIGEYQSEQAKLMMCSNRRKYSED